MKEVLRNRLCYRNIGDITLYEDGKQRIIERPKLFILKAKLLFSDEFKSYVNVNILLDTGNDITIIDFNKVRELERKLGFLIEENKSYPYYGHTDPQPAFDLKLVLKGGYVLSSTYGFIAPKYWDFDVADVWIGQDIFSQLITTFNGPEGNVTIIDPNHI
jgi:hypothetical protein